jgi:hypothetical protein
MTKWASGSHTSHINDDTIFITTALHTKSGLPFTRTESFKSGDEDLDWIIILLSHILILANSCHYLQNAPNHLPT